MMLETSFRTAYDGDHDAFRETVRKVFGRALAPNQERYEREGIVDRAFWLACGEAGLLCHIVMPSSIIHE